MKTKLYFYLLLFALISCVSSKKKENIQPLILGEKHAFELEKLNFNEDVMKLYSKVSSNKQIHEAFAEYEAFPNFAILEKAGIMFKIFEVKSLKILVPENPYGFEFKSKKIDSIAKFHNMYFNQLNSLTNLDKKLVAIYASSRYRNEEERDSLLLSLNEFYGKALFQMPLSSDFALESHIWVTKNKIIEVTTSFGHSAEFSTTGETKRYKYYKLNLLIVNSRELKSLVRAHRGYFDDNFKRSYYDEPKLIHSDYLPRLIEIKEFCLSNKFD